MIIGALVGLAPACSSSDDNPGVPDPGMQVDARPPETGGGERPGVIFLSTTGAVVQGTALFAGKAATVSPGVCTTDAIGPCEIQRCPSVTDAPDGKLATAGRIVITGASQTIVMTQRPDLDNDYDVTEGSAAELVPGETLVLAATGGDVPAFSGISAKVPGDIFVTEDYSLVDFGADLEIHWTGGEPVGKVYARFQSDDDTNLVTATCAFDPPARHGTVPTAVWQKLAACPDGGDVVCSWLISPQFKTSFTAGDWAIDFFVLANGAGGQLNSK